MNRITIAQNAHITGKYANRHGLIAGATGTGKTVTLQKLCEQFSDAGVPVFVADVKGDIAGLAMDGKGKASPVKLWDVFSERGHDLKITVAGLGPDLIARMLELTDAQQGIIERAFSRNDKIQTLEELRREIGFCVARSSATYAAIERAIYRFARNGGDDLTNGTCFDIAELFKRDESDRGIINILDAEKLMANPATYSTMMIWILDQLFTRLPESGDVAVPHFVIFIDEAHLLFSDAPPALLQKIERTVRLIRSKGVGVYFVTQAPDDVPAAVLGQLGNRIQHALRGATIRDQKAIRAAAETMPTNPAIKAADLIGKLAIGQALFSFIGEDSTPQPVQIMQVELPRCRLGALTAAERSAMVPARVAKVAPVQDVERVIPKRVTDKNLVMDLVKVACVILAVAGLYFTS